MLEVSHGAYKGRYSTFNDMRYWLAKQVGIDLDQYTGYRKFPEGGGRDLDEITHDLKPLLNRSDCDGIITPEDCRMIAEGIDMALKSFGNTKSPFVHLAVQFRNGCAEAYNKNQSLIFN